jgi:acetyl esterase
VPLHPQAKALCDAVNAMGGAAASDDRLQEARDGLALLTATGVGEPRAVARVEDRSAPGPAGPVPVRIYRPTLDDGLPVLVWLHGGGWTIGSIDVCDGIARAIADAAHCVVVSVEYRLAPEHPFPAPLDDSWAGLQWAAAHAAEFGGDPTRVAVGGDSAGGNLAAVCALLARDAGAPNLALQLLVYPATDAACDTESQRVNGAGYLLDAAQMAWFYDCYLRAGGDPQDGRISPLRAPSVAGTAPARVITAEYDPLRDEGEAYAQRLADAGVPVTVSRYDGMIHAFYGLTALFDDASRALDETVEALHGAFGTLSPNTVPSETSA